MKTTLLDYPGHVASTVFLGGCNMRCVFCHNMDIVDRHGASGESYTESYTVDEILAHLAKRKGIIDGVCITGGEPTLYNDLPDFIKKIKELGLLIKLDTNGTNPEMLKALINNKLIDYVAMDIKASFDKYDKICGIKCDHEKIKQSIDILISSGIDNKGKSPEKIDYEFRTTCVIEYHDAAEMEKIGKMLKGAKNYYLQAFKDSDFVLERSLNVPDKPALERYVEILKDYIENVQIRGVD